MSESFNKLQPDRTLYLRGFDSFAAAATIRNASPTGFRIGGIFRDPADFAVAVLYDADNTFEHPSVRYLPDFNLAGIVLTCSLLYTDAVQPIDSPKYNWIDWATLDCILEDGTTAKIPLLDNALLADPSFPAASATLNVLIDGIQIANRLTLWYQNLAFDYTVPGGLSGSAAYVWQASPSTASIAVGTTTYTYNVTAPGGEDGATIAAGVATAAAADPQVAFTASGDTLTFASKVNTGGSVYVGGYWLWLITDSPDAFIAAAMATFLNTCDWVSANTTHGLIASATGPALTITAAQYGTANVNGASVTWVSGTKFSGLTAGSTILLAGTAYSIASVQSPLQLTLTAAATTATAVPYLAPRGGRDGNMIELYSLASSPSQLCFDRSAVTLAGGSSAVTWNLSIDFTALGIDQLRQCWLTFAPSLSNGAAFTAAEWLATFSNWQIADPNSVAPLQVAGPGSIRLEEDSPSCSFTANWSLESGFYSRYFANAASLVNESVTVTYTCQFTHNLYLGTSLYIDRGVAGVSLDGDPQTQLNCYLNTGSAVVTRRLLRSSVAAGKHTVVITVVQAGIIYFDFLEAAVLSGVPAPLAPRANISAALDFDTDQTYMVSPARLLWMMNQLGYAGPINEYLGVFWWNQRVASGGSFSTAQVTFAGAYAGGDSIVLEFDPPDGTELGKSVFPDDTLDTIAAHFAYYINSSLTSAWASAAGNVLTIVGRSPSSPYNLSLTATVTSAAGTAAVSPTQPAAGIYPNWMVDDTANPPINCAVADWHADFYSQCAALELEVVTSCSLELVNPPTGYAALFPDRTAVATATGFGTLNSTQCAVGNSALVAYQKSVYRQIAQMQSAAGLTPSLQYGEFLWWYFNNSSGMAFYDSETTAAAQTALGRPLHVFLTPNDDPTVNGSADATFLRDRLRDHVAALVADIRSAYPTVKCEVLWPYDVNYPTPTGGEGGQLNYFVNLPVEWQQQPSSGLDTMKVEALNFAAGLRNLDLAWQAIQLFPSFGWPVTALRYLVPVFGSATPWNRELALVWGIGMPEANLWALDHVCLYNLDVPEPPLDRRSVVKTR